MAVVHRDYMVSGYIPVLTFGRLDLFKMEEVVDRVLNGGPPCKSVSLLMLN